MRSPRTRRWSPRPESSAREQVVQRREKHPTLSARSKNLIQLAERQEKHSEALGAVQKHLIQLAEWREKHSAGLGDVQNT